MKNEKDETARILSDESLMKAIREARKKGSKSSPYRPLSCHVTRKVIAEWYIYPDWKSRLVTWFWRLVGLSGGEVWHEICEVEIGRKELSDAYDETYELLIDESDTRRRQVWIIKSLVEKQ